MVRCKNRTVIFTVSSGIFGNKEKKFEIHHKRYIIREFRQQWGGILECAHFLENILSCLANFYT